MSNPAHVSAMSRLVDLLSQPSHTVGDVIEVEALREWLRNYEQVQREAAGIDVDALLWQLYPGGKVIEFAKPEVVN